MQTDRGTRRASDEWLGRMFKISRRWFAGLITVNLVGLLALAFHVGMWRYQAMRQDDEQQKLIVRISALEKVVSEQGAAISRLVGVLEGRQAAPPPIARQTGSIVQAASLPDH